MKRSFEGIGQWAATFACGNVSAGQVVKVSGDGTVSGCAAGDEIAGVVLSASRDGGACAVVLGGMVTVGYTGAAAPAVGWSAMSADGSGGMAADEDGKAYLVVCVDTAAKTVTFVL